MLFKNGTEITIALALVAALAIIWTSLVDLRGSGLFYEAPAGPAQQQQQQQQGDADAFLKQAVDVEFPAPIDYASIREICTRRPDNFRPGANNDRLPGAPGVNLRRLTP